MSALLCLPAQAAQPIPAIIFSSDRPALVAPSPIHNLSQLKIIRRFSASPTPQTTNKVRFFLIKFCDPFSRKRRDFVR